ncbi:MAG: DNA-directed RNA polymerase subunit beta [Chloroflexi bacterium]|nr:DNA-directed RNA polymerase subunit beta [Chloroflexota bacterium]
MAVSVRGVINRNMSVLNNRVRSYARIPDVHPLPSLIEVQRTSYEWLIKEGLRELFEEISPIVSYNGNLELHFLDYRFEEPKYSEEECRTRDMTFAAPLYVRARLINRETGGEIPEQDVYLGDFPLMTSNGTFIINGAERVVVSQLIRSPGAYFKVEEDRVTGRLLCMAKLIPNRGAWLEFETSKRDVISVKVDRKRKIPITVLLRALGTIEVEGQEADNALIVTGTDEELLSLFASVDTMPEHSYIQSTMERDPTTDAASALEEFFKRMRPGDPATFENARSYLSSLLFHPRRYDLGKVGRYKLNKHLGLDVPLDHRTLTKRDLIKIVERIIQVNNGVEDPDDIDHLGNRRVKTVGELIQNQLRISLLRMERMVRDRMSTRDPEQVTPVALINIRPIVAGLREFFGGSQLSQFMDQTNPLAELTNKRRLSALGPGGLRRERAGFDVRDVHHSHYGRICPIETPEGPNIGLIGSLSTYARVNEYGFIETPYRKVIHSLPPDPKLLEGRTVRERILDPKTEEVIAEPGTKIDAALAKRIKKAGVREVKIVPVATNEVVYLTADEEDHYVIAQANARLDDDGQFLDKRVSVRYHQNFLMEAVEKVDYMDVSPKQIVGVSAALIPFLEHDDANRALMGSNMQRQAVPLIAPEAPLVGTAIEKPAALDSGQVIIAENDGEVVSVTGQRIVVQGNDGQKVYHLRRYSRTNQSTCLDQRPIVNKGDHVKAGDVLADSSSTDRGELALGQNVIVAFLSWEGGNYEDAILISEALVRNDKFTSIHIEKHEVEARDTKLGPEEITRDIPNVGEDALRNLDEEGIIRIGAEVGPGDILVGKITPKGETELTPEEKLLRAIFGEKAWEVKDSSLRLPHGERGKVVDIRTFSREEHPDMAPGVDKMVRVSVAQRRKITEGDKMAGRHGNKGVISKVVSIADMPYLADGTPVDIILNPLGVPARMNVGQILEAHLGWAASRMGFRAVSPVFDGADETEIMGELARAWLIDRAWEDATRRAWQWLHEQDVDTTDLEDDEEARRVYLRHVLEVPDDQDVDEVVSDWASARWAWLAQWLKERGYDIRSIQSTIETDLPVSERGKADQRAVNLCLRLWLEDHGVDVSNLSDQDIEDKAARVSLEVKEPLPISGKMILYDGKTGEPFDRPVTVGIIYMMKLAHLVEDKVHARSTGPYSLVTQQPLGGKAQLGGQRFGEMEVWALEAYGAAHTLQEMLTVKSDDVTGRVKTYEAIVKGERISEPGIPESFRVLVKELQSLALSVEVLNENGERIQFGREESEEPLPRLGLGLGVPGFARERTFG